MGESLLIPFMFSDTGNLPSTCMSLKTDLRMLFHSLNLAFASRFTLARMAIREVRKTETEKLTHAVKFKCRTLKLTWKQKWHSVSEVTNLKVLNSSI